MKQTKVSEVVRRIAYIKKISMTELAKQMKMSYSHLMNLINGNRPISDESKIKFIKVLNMTYEEKNEFKEALFISQNEIKIKTNNKKECLLRLFYWLTIKGNQLSEQQINDMLNTVKTSQRQKNNQTNNHN